MPRSRKRKVKVKDHLIVILKRNRNYISKILYFKKLTYLNMVIKILVNIIVVLIKSYFKKYNLVGKHDNHYS